MSIDSDTIETLLNMDEGTSLDVKREQYRFVKATDSDKSELLKDILAFSNTQRYRTAYILIGVEEVQGGRSKVVGVQNHLDDADLHQFVNNKTNRSVEFSYSPRVFENKQIGVLRIPLQSPPIYALRKYGKVNANTVYIRDGSATRSASPDEIAAMGRGNPPRIVEWTITRLRSAAMNAIVTTAEEWQAHPGRYSEYGQRRHRLSYPEAREWVLNMVDERLIDPTQNPDGMDTYGSLHWIFQRFEELAEHCALSIKTIGPALIESGALVRAIVELEDYIRVEKSVWDEFWRRTNDETAPLPGHANYNLLSVAARTARFADVLEDEDRYGDPDHEALSPHLQPIFWHSDKWGDWRR